MVRIRLILVLFICYSSISSSSNNPQYLGTEKLQQAESEDYKTLTLNYNAISCTCAQWSESKYNNQPDKRVYFYLERANNNLVNADTLFDGENFPVQIEVTGKFITESGYPKDYNPPKGKGKPAKVFKYAKIKVLQNGQKNINR